MKQSDRKFYEAREREDIKRAKTMSKANYRAEKSVEWHKTNQLTPETANNFKKEMKKADKEWESLNAL
jgi:ribosomal protein S12 methylthiotransferase accessory factor YcaO